jgi:ABC-type branched-subunit amino acid transport system substrate-binding protein
MVIGTGETTVALLLPLSAGGSASGLAEIFRNAAELALMDADRQAVRVLVKDTKGSEDGGRFAAETAVAEGARMIIGPIFAPAVVGAGGVARSAGIPMVAFSTDAAVAGRGINLLSFLPRQDAERVVSYAANQGRRGFAALVPNNAYGVVMEAAFREAVANSGVNAVMVERYEPGGDIAEKAAAIAGRGEQIDAVFIPNGGDDPSAAAAVLFSRGMSRNKVKLLGSGQWDNRAVLQSPGLTGAWFPAPQKIGFADVSDRYQARYGVAPPRTVSLVYDAVALANGLALARGPQALTNEVLTSRDGYAGVDGVFRLTSEGLSQRGLAVFEIDNVGTAQVVSPPPVRFSRA